MSTFFPTDHMPRRRAMRLIATNVVNAAVAIAAAPVTAGEPSPELQGGDAGKGQTPQATAAFDLVF